MLDRRKFAAIEFPEAVTLRECSEAIRGEVGKVRRRELSLPETIQWPVYADPVEHSRRSKHCTPTIWKVHDEEPTLTKVLFARIQGSINVG